MQDNVLVIQSHRSPLPHAWLQACLDSVQGWAGLHGFAYRFVGDELFNRIDPELRLKTAQQIVVASDLARLMEIEAALMADYTCVVWCDADFLVFAPQDLILGDASYSFGREVWIQPANNSKTRLKAYSKIHNAFMFFKQNNPFLSFYIDSVQKMLHQHRGPFAPQFAGPKFLSAIHNISKQPVVENACMLCPMVIKDLLQNGGDALSLFQQKSPVPPAGINLCASLVGKEITDKEIEQAIGIMMN